MQRIRVGFALSSLPRCQFDTTVLPLATIQLCFISAVPISPTLLNMTPTHLLTLSMSPLSAHRVHRWDLPLPKMSGLQAFVRCQDICRIGICNISLYLCCAPNYCANLFANKYLASVCQSSQLTTQLQIADFTAWDDSFKTEKHFVVIIVVRCHKQGLTAIRICANLHQHGVVARATTLSISVPKSLSSCSAHHLHSFSCKLQNWNRIGCI